MNKINENHGILFFGQSAIVKTNGMVPKTNSELLNSESFKLVLHRFLKHLTGIGSPLIDIFPEHYSMSQKQDSMLQVLKLLNEKKREDILNSEPKLRDILEDIYSLHQFIEEFYNYWRSFERYLICLSQTHTELDKKPYRTFNQTISLMNHLIRGTYRDICENLTGDHPQIYRQLSAGFQVGLIAVKNDLKLPSICAELKSIHIIRQLLLYPPLIMDPLMNKRDGEFVKVSENPIDNLKLDEKEWLCYPARVGELLILIYFHDKFIGLGCALSNLFELADDKTVLKAPDAIIMFGLPQESMQKYQNAPGVFYDSEEILIGAVSQEDKFGYFGYLKKMALTLHNIIMMKRSRMPVHGAMVRIELNNGHTANILIVGDTGAGKSESLEAFRILAKEHIRRMTIIFDDMGSLKISGDDILAYGTEIGAFVRLDDLQPGFAFGNIDRSILMSPHKKNARAVLPVTNITEILRGHRIDFFLYANNYEEVDEKHPYLEKIEKIKEAYRVFKEGKVMSKGTTFTSGLVRTYFSNIFGPVQYKEEHDKIATTVFKRLFDIKRYVGQLRTQLGIRGKEIQGPELAALALFEFITANRKN